MDFPGGPSAIRVRTLLDCFDWQGHHYHLRAHKGTTLSSVHGVRWRTDGVQPRESLWLTLRLGFGFGVLLEGLPLLLELILGQMLPAFAILALVAATLTDV